MSRFLSVALSLLLASLVVLLHPLTDAQAAPAAAATPHPKKKGSVPASHPATAPAKNKTNQKKQKAAHPSAPAKRTASTAGKAAAAGKQPKAASHHSAPAKKAGPAHQAKKTKKETKKGAAIKKGAARHPAHAAPADSAPPDLEQQISARSAIILDAKTGEELFAKYPDNPRQPASTIKIVTAMIAIKSLKGDELVDVSSHAASMPSSKVFLETGKQYQVDDLLNAVLLASANDASVALAEKVAGSEENFANLMTLSARMWGARHTVCRTASGLTALGQQSTSRDLATIFRYAMQHDAFARRMREKFITTSYGKVLRNHNRALWRLDCALGGKTGYTVVARQTYVGLFGRDDQTIVVALMGSETMWSDLAKLVEYGFKKQKDGQLARVNPRAADGAARN
ncbi:MAG: serine hydrolase [Proteobacteria bacterium]|nr:serine hydrolase [Pseudomonadota bacterium]